MNIEKWKELVERQFSNLYPLKSILNDWEKDRNLLLKVIEEQLDEIGILQNKIKIIELSEEDRRKSEYVG